MIKYSIRRCLQMILLLLLISFLIFAGLNLTGTDPVYFTVGIDNFDDTEMIELMREKFGLNDPLIVRYFRWIGNMLRGNFGYSLVSGQAIGDMLATRWVATFELALLALVCSTVLGVLLGILAAIRQNSVADYAARILAIVGQAVPSYFIGICLIEIFGVKLGWLPTSNRMSVGDVTFFDRFDHLVLPLISMTFSMFAALTKYTRNNMLDVANRDYVKTARSKGIPEWKVYTKHIFRNGMRPVMVVIVFRLGTLIGGSVAIESVFSWPGMGGQLKQAIISGDYPVVMVISLLIGCVMLVASFLVDIITALLDPRVRFGK